jgi:hypothetical protein
MSTDARTYFEMAKEREAELEMEAPADGSALTPQAQRLAVLKAEAGRPQPTTYAAMAREPEQLAALDQSATGHDALRLQAQRGRNPIYPAQPNNVWAADAGNIERPFPIDVSAVADMETVDGKPRAKAET